MFNYTLKVEGKLKVYIWRLFLAQELVKETRRDDQAIYLGIINLNTSSRPIKAIPIVL